MYLPPKGLMPANLEASHERNDCSLPVGNICLLGKNLPAVSSKRRRNWHRAYQVAKRTHLRKGGVRTEDRYANEGLRHALKRQLTPSRDRSSPCIRHGGVRKWPVVRIPQGRKRSRRMASMNYSTNWPISASMPSGIFMSEPMKTAG